MPRLSVWMIRAALIYLGTGFTFGALMLWNKGLPFDGRVWLLRNAHIEILLFGWMIQLAMGTAFWIMPRFLRTPKYGNVRLAWLAFILLNTGIISVALDLILPGRILELLAGLCFAISITPRVKPFGVSEED